jgi:hypothetical protein
MEFSYIEDHPHIVVWYIQSYRLLIIFLSEISLIGRYD